jgi:AcrR family transcriptional regulator
MENDIEIKNRIIDAAQKQFIIHGFTKVTMDEIASKMGMSKKTIYKFYPSKTELVCAMTDKVFAETEIGFRNILNDTKIDFLEKLQKTLKFVGIHLSKLSRPLIEDIRHNAPQLWENISDYRKKNIYQYFGSLIREGRQKGMFRDDIDEHLLILIYMNIVENIVNPEILSQLPLTATQAYEAVMKVVFEGILTDEARLHLKPLTNITKTVHEE